MLNIAVVRPARDIHARLWRMLADAILVFWSERSMDGYGPPVAPAREIRDGRGKLFNAWKRSQTGEVDAGRTFAMRRSGDRIPLAPQTKNTDLVSVFLFV